jgi:hypothetical protein
MRNLFTACAVAYVVLYAFEGVIRYGLYGTGLDAAILLRDLLILGPLAMLFVAQLLRGRVHPAYAAFAILIVMHGAISAVNLDSWVPAIYGAKTSVNILFGFLAASQLVQPGKKVLVIFMAVWMATVIGVGLDKFVYTFPWMGLETHIGGVQVDVSRGWDINDAFQKRAAGFSRSSISTAILLPTLAIIVTPRIRSFTIRALMLALTMCGVFLTTQKGSFVALAVVLPVLCAPKWNLYGPLSLACIGLALFDAALPILTSGLWMPQGADVFSLSSFAMRITLTWPEAWRWVADHEVFPFGVGLGGIGGAQRFYAADFFNPGDNLFVYLYANFGIFAAGYLAWVASLGPRLPRDRRPDGRTALVLLTYLFGYGAVLSLLEDQIAALFFGAAAGTLWQLRQRAYAGNWSESYQGFSPWPWWRLSAHTRIVGSSR